MFLFFEGILNGGRANEVECLTPLQSPSFSTNVKGNKQLVIWTHFKSSIELIAS